MNKDEDSYGLEMVSKLFLAASTSVNVCGQFVVGLVNTVTSVLHEGELHHNCDSTELRKVGKERDSLAR